MYGPQPLDISMLAPLSKSSINEVDVISAGHNLHVKPTEGKANVAAESLSCAPFA